MTKKLKPPAGRSDSQGTEVAPVNLSAFARGKLQHQVGGLAHGTNLAANSLRML